MPTYLDWNNAILQYVLTGLPLGSRVYLTIDDEALEDIGRQFKIATPETGWTNDFLNAVHQRCIIKGRVDFERLKPIKDYPKPPRYLAFLCAMVLAAYSMGDDQEEDIGSTNYLIRLNQVLELPGVERPHGLEGGREEALWDDWATWLRSCGYIPSATKRGVQYITYPISQTLLRQSDKDNLWKHFSLFEVKFPRDFSADGLADQLYEDTKHEVQSLTKHTRRLLRSDGKLGSQRYEDLSRVLYEVFEAWNLSGRQMNRSKAARLASKRNIVAGLYRTENRFLGKRSYFVLPQQPRYIHIEQALLEYRGERYELLEDRPGWFEPLWEISTEDLIQGIKTKIQGNSDFDSLIMPPHNYWIMTPDPDDPESGVYASWNERPDLGTPFFLLCHEELIPQLHTLKNEGLIKWQGDPSLLADDSNWVEYRGMMVVSDAWRGVSIPDEGLYRQLKPQRTIGLSIRGGMRDPNSRAWLVNHGPEIVIYSFVENVEVQIYDALTNEMVKAINSAKANLPIEVEWPMPGEFQIEISTGNETREQFIKIIDWDQLDIVKLDMIKPVKLGTNTIFGAWIDVEQSKS